MTAGVSSTATDRVAAAAARGAATVFVGYAGLHLALAAGAPLGEHVWGGRAPAVLPGRMRAGGLAASGVLVGMAVVVRARAGLGPGVPGGAHRLGPLTWAISGYLAVNTVGNLVSSSRIERYVSGSATAAAAVLTAIVAHRGR